MSGGRQPRRKLYAYWMQDVSGEWLLRSDTNWRAIKSEHRIESWAYPTTQIDEFTTKAPLVTHAPRKNRNRSER